MYTHFILILLVLTSSIIAQSGYTLTEVGEFGGFDDTGIITHGMVQYDQYLYSIDNETLAIYDVESDPASPALIKSINIPGANKIFLDYSFGTILITTENGGTHGFIKYSLNDPLNPVAAQVAETPAAVLAILVTGGTFANVIEDQVDSLFVYYIGSTTPYKVDAYSLPGNGRSLGQDPWAHILFVGYENGIRVYNTSNTFDYVQQFEQPLNSDLPQRIAPLTPIKKIFVGLNNSGQSSISCYSYDDPANLQFVQQQTVSADNELWDLKWEFSEAFLIVSLNLGGELQTYLWDDDTESFSYGPSLFMDSPTDIITYFHFNPAPNGKKSKNEIMGSGDDYIYVPNGYAYGTRVEASEKTKIVKVIPPGGGDQVTLTMNIEPPEAVNHGCSTTPTPGQYQYDVGTETNLYALPNEAEGWYFTGWTGDASGTDLVYHIVMDENMNVTANFAIPELTISGETEDEIHCPTDIEEESEFEILPIEICASDMDDWTFHGITLESWGVGDDVTDIHRVNIYLNGAGNLIYSGVYPSDNGDLHATFTPAVQIGAGECVTLYVVYDFNFDPQTRCNHGEISFMVETSAPVAEPVNYEIGNIMGSAESSYLFFGRVFNDEHDINSTIQDAIDYSYGDDEIWSVCPGTYKENINIEKKNNIIIESVEGIDNTFIAPPSNIEKPAIKISDSQFIRINGFSIKYSAPFPNSAVYLVHSSNASIVNNNIVSTNNSNARVGIDVFACKNIELINNSISYFYFNILFTASYFSNIIRNSFMNYDIKGGGIYLTGSDNNSMSENTFWFTGNPAIETFYSDNLSIDRNIFDRNQIGISLNNSDDVNIINNTFNSNCTGIKEIGCARTILSGNRVDDGHCENTGIHLSNTSSEILGNSISNNNGNGIMCEDNSTVSLSSNNIEGNEEFGLNNGDPNITIIADGNYWGNAAGPSGSDIGGQVSISSWLDTPVSLVVSTLQDTLFVVAGEEDSLSIYFQNLLQPDDVIDVSITDNTGWLPAPIDTTLAMNDSLGQDITLHLTAPADAVHGASDWIRYTAVSQVDGSTSVSDSLLVQMYGPVMQRIIVSPDSMTIAPEASLQFYAAGFDQTGQLYQILPSWSATGGSIDSTGFFTAGAATGWFAVTVEDTALHIAESANIHISATVSVEDNTAPTPTAFSLDQNYPNPFNPITTINYQLPEPSNVVITVYDILGHKVRDLINGNKTAGYKSVTWNGLDDNGKMVSCGIYIYHLKAGQYSSSKKLLFLK